MTPSPNRRGTKNACLGAGVNTWLSSLQSLLQTGCPRGSQSGRLALQTQRLAFEYHTDEWLALLVGSFQSVDKAWEQCDRDWPRMNVVDERSYLRRAKDYLGASRKPLVAYFANQACLARPFHMVMQAAGPSTVVTQYGGPDLTVTLGGDGSVSLEKKILVHKTGARGVVGGKAPWRTVQARVRVERKTARIEFHCI